MTDEKNMQKDTTSKTSNIVLWLRDFSVFAVLWLTFSTAGWTSFHIPSGSMEPTLEVGDRIFVSKFPYGYNRYSVPLDPEFISENHIFPGAPNRGEVAVFTVPKLDNQDTIKRVIGLPGDHIEMIAGRLYINKNLVQRRFVRTVNYVDYNGTGRRAREYDETLPGGVTHRIYELSDTGRFDNTGPFLVPPNHYFMMGDNRDNSLDSRYQAGIGYVPINYFLGQADITTFSLYNCDQGKDIFCPLGVPLGRFFNSIE